MYYSRQIDKYLSEWAKSYRHKPLMLRGARQVGKSTAVHHLGECFANMVEINFEKSPVYSQLFEQDLDVKRIVPQIAAMAGQPIVPGKTLLFLDEIQECEKAIMSLRFFKEDMPDLHVIAAGSLLEFALDEIPTFGVGRIHSMFIYPMSFDEFLVASGNSFLMNARNQASSFNPLPVPLYEKLVSLLRTYILIGGMPESVATWVERHDYIACQEVQDDIVVAYEADFAKYRKKIEPELLLLTLRSASLQVTKKFVYAQVRGYHSENVKKALRMLSKAGILLPVTSTSANGIPLGAEEDASKQKFLIVDTGLMLRLMNMSTGSVSEITRGILTDNVTDLVNKGPMAEMLAGLELQRYRTPNLRHSLYYWQREAKNSQAEIDYLSCNESTVLPIEVKAGTQGGMKSLWIFMREKHLSKAIRCSMENFGMFTYKDPLDNDESRDVAICPLFAVSQMGRVLNELEKK